MLAAHESAYLQQQGGFSYPGVAADKHQGAFDKSAAQHPVQFGNPGVVTGFILVAYAIDGGEFQLPDRRCGFPSDKRSRLRFLYGVPASAGGAPAVPL